MMQQQSGVGSSGSGGSAPTTTPHTDTSLTKLFVGGLPYHTTSDSLKEFFGQYGLIDEAVVIMDRITGRSKGYGFVTFNDVESAKNACEQPNPVIEGRIANCNLASLGAKKRTMGGGANNGAYASNYQQGGWGQQYQGMYNVGGYGNQYGGYANYGMQQQYGQAYGQNYATGKPQQGYAAGYADQAAANFVSTSGSGYANNAAAYQAVMQQQQFAAFPQTIPQVQQSQTPTLTQSQVAQVTSEPPQY